MSSIAVTRKAFTVRDIEVEGTLSGVIEAEIEALSYIHVSMGRERLERLIDIKTAASLLNTVEEALIKGDIKALQRVSSYVALDYIDNVVYGDSVCIPGSTIKGLLRARLELCPAKDGSAISCMRSDVKPISSPPPPGAHGWRHARIWKAVSENRGPYCNPIETQDYTICVVCDIFGAPGVVGRVMPSNFCCSLEAYEKRDLPYGEKVYAIKPGTRLKGSIMFSALKLEEIGALLISMGIAKGSSIGIPVLIGKHKYAYPDMGKARFMVVALKAPLRFAETLAKWGLNCSVEHIEIICREKELQKLIDMAIDETLTRYPQLSQLHGFSEADVKDKVVAK
ncbi:MAG: RAMP superfamily CRISPR-associated protein [Ignisphaera sp.]